MDPVDLGSVRSGLPGGISGIWLELGGRRFSQRQFVERSSLFRERLRATSLRPVIDTQCHLLTSGGCRS